jgi:hypothetical protein
MDPIEKDKNTGIAREIVNDDRRVRQAVVVIHGMGEQQPMETLRSFVDAVLPEHPGDSPKYRSKPDAMNDLLETRCLQAPRNRQSGRPLTDFYEYYWAHHMQGSKYSQVLKWLLKLMLRRPGHIPRALKPAYFLSWLLTLTALSLWLIAVVETGKGEAGFMEGMGIVTGLIMLAVQWVGAFFILGYVADAARYLTPSPGNIEARNKIRSEGIKLLRTLHKSGKYRRIVVVGHSLGSVIGYDIIRHLWVDLRKPEVPYPQKQTELKQFEKEAKKLDEGDLTAEKIEQFQQYQHGLWQEYRKVGIPWLVTDFLTMGSPLAHALLLMADDPDSCKLKMEQYEYPCCPLGGRDSPYYGQQYQMAGDGGIRNLSIPHHGAAFSSVRWTNLYFPYRWLVLGDLVAGKLNSVFGKGIRDIPVTPPKGKFLDRTLLSHIRYWTVRQGGSNSLEALRKALRLDFLTGNSWKIRPGLPANDAEDKQPAADGNPTA